MAHLLPWSNVVLTHGRTPYASSLPYEWGVCRSVVNILCAQLLEFRLVWFTDQCCGITPRLLLFETKVFPLTQGRSNFVSCLYGHYFEQAILTTDWTFIINRRRCEADDWRTAFSFQIPHHQLIQTSIFRHRFNVLVLWHVVFRISQNTRIRMARSGIPFYTSGPPSVSVIVLEFY